jgi:hypothetical protein
MNANHQLVHGAIASLLALGLGAASMGALAQKVAATPKPGSMSPRALARRIAGGAVTNEPENVHGGAAAVKKGHLGGTCVNDGCMPTKTRVARARAARATMA